MRKLGVAFAVWFAVMAGLAQAATVQAPTVLVVAPFAEASGAIGTASAERAPVAMPPDPGTGPIVIPVAPTPASAPRAASTPRVAATPNPCPVAGWAYEAWTTTHETPTWGATTASAARTGTIPADRPVEACRRPDGWLAVTSYGWIRPGDK